MKSKSHVLVLTLSPLDNDSRIKKTIKFIKNGLGFNFTAVSVNSTIHDNEREYVTVQHRKRRILGVPGISLVWLYLKYLKVLLKIKLIDVVYANDLNTLPFAVLLKRLSRNKIKLIYDAHEYETELNGLKKSKKKWLKWLECKLIKHADEVVTVSDAIANEYVRLYNIHKPHLVLNCPPYQEVEKHNVFREKLGLRNDQLIFLYQGGLSLGRGIEILLEAFEKLSSDKKVLVCMGYGSLESLVKEKSKTSNNIYFHPAVSSEVLLDYTSSADYGILFYEDSCLNHRYCSPNKMFEYLMAGLPVLTSNLYEMKRLVQTQNVGVVAPENNVKGFIKAVNASLKQDYAQIQDNVQSVKSIYCWEAQEKVLLGVFNGL